MAPALDIAWAYVPTGRQCRQGQLALSRTASTRFEIAVQKSRGSAVRLRPPRENGDPTVTIVCSSGDPERQRSGKGAKAYGYSRR